MFKFDFFGIGTGWFVDIDVSSIPLQNSISNNVIKIVKVFEDNYSRFKDSSLIGKLNKEKSLKNPPLELIQMIKMAQGLKDLTQGSFDVMVGKRLSDSGYDKDLSFKNTNSSHSNLTSQNAKNKLVSFSNEQIVVQENGLMDLGGIGKGFLIDKVSNYLQSEQVKNFTVNAGGDIFCKSENFNKFYLENPFDNSQAIGEIDLKNGGIACSSSSKRNWKSGTRQFHHLIDMNSGETVSEIAAVFTYGKNALNTDLGSTAIFVSDSKCWFNISKFLDIEFLVVFSDGKYFQTEYYPGRMYR